MLTLSSGTSISSPFVIQIWLTSHVVISACRNGTSCAMPQDRLKSLARWCCDDSAMILGNSFILISWLMWIADSGAVLYCRL